MSTTNTPREVVAHYRRYINDAYDCEDYRRVGLLRDELRRVLAAGRKGEERMRLPVFK